LLYRVRAFVYASAAESAALINDFCVSVLDLDRLYRAVPHATIAVAAVVDFGIYRILFQNEPPNNGFSERCILASLNYYSIIYPSFVFGVL
jgi:hypothetical protein